MGIVIKKISRKTIISIFSVGGILLAFFGRFFFGSNHINLSRLNESNSMKLIDVANADTPPPPGTGTEIVSGGSDAGGSGDGGK